MQLIIIMETRKSCRSDYYYIKSTIDYFYKSQTFSIKPIFAKCKSELIKQDKTILKHITKYPGKSYVTICADYDRDDDPDNKKLIDYCLSNKYELIWMNKNIEDVYINKKHVKDKEKEAISFLKSSNSFFAKCNNLKCMSAQYKTKSSNILFVLDKLLPRK